MCGIVAVSGNTDVIHDIYESLTVLQHRGQDASGILTNYNGKITLRKSLGLVRDGFSNSDFTLFLSADPECKNNLNV